ncbi:response regulator transcription factor [Methylovorus glucosotrophus]|uniref:Two component transcriptional regulator, LuxR family n=1 Tax=Methylovorus glucosotrophus (strain SIP3-4) TaxID=582744 RepID=C6XDI5_METGS|nr:response regulator transcription factor [Methylovorus glucosotrophus]ACT50610.1 two component transcriptional regulator, LuxR family [Methylovorus glucosotrophus SIP3-4]
MRIHNVMLVNGYRVSRYALRQLLEATGEFRVTESATSAVAAAHAVIPPDLLLIDISDPAKNGLETLCDLMHDFPELPCLIVGGPGDATLRNHYVRLGCRAYIPRDASKHAILQAATALLSSKPAAQPSGRNTPDAVHLPHIDLSARERQVFFKLTSGKSIPSVARELLISASSVSVFRCKILRKMHCSNNAELISYAFRHRLLNT